MEITKISLLLSVLAIFGAFADQQTVEMTYVESVDEFQASNPAVELKEMKSFIDEKNKVRTYFMGARKPGKNQSTNYEL